MSNFVAKIIPFLPSSMQFEELTEAASSFNRFSEQLASCKTFHEEKMLIRTEWDIARKRLLACRDGDTILTFDFMSILLYILSIDHWALSDSDRKAFDPVPMIGKLLHSEEFRARKIGSLAAMILSGEETGLLLANTISKMLDSSQAKSLELALEVAGHLLSHSLVPLFSKGIIRCLRNRSPSVRKAAWISYSNLMRSDEHTILDSQILKNLVMTETDVDVLCAISSFFNTHHDTREVAKLWIEHVQSALTRTPHAVLQCKLIRLVRSLHLESVDLLKSILNIEFGEKQPAVHLELLKTLSVSIGDDASIGPFAMLPGSYFETEESTATGLLMLKQLARHSIKTVLLYQEQLLAALDSDDPEIRLLALRILELAANSENWKLLLENCTKIVEMCQPIESETIVQATKIALKLICMFEESPKILESTLRFFDQLPESISEEHLDSLLNVIKLGSKPVVSFVTRSYIFSEERHSLIHDLYLIYLASQEAPLDPNFSARILVDFLERECRNSSDPLSVKQVLFAMSWQACRGVQVNITDAKCVSKLSQWSTDRTLQWLVKLVTTANPDMIAEFAEANGNVDTIIAQVPIGFEERIGQFKQEFTKKNFRPVLEIIDNRSTESFNRDLPAEEEPVFPSIREIPTFPASESSDSKITSDLFKGLL